MRSSVVKFLVTLWNVLAVSCVISTRAQAAPPTPMERAKAVLKAQVAAMPDNETGLASTFAKDAVVQLPHGSAHAQGDEDHKLGTEISFMYPHARLTKATFDRVVAGGNDNMAWFTAELTFVIADDGSTTYRVRAVELLDSAAGWKPVVAGFMRVGPIAYKVHPTGVMPDPTTPGPLAKLVASPDALAGTLAPDAVVLGSDLPERAVGRPAAKALLSKWSKLGLVIEEADKVREVTTKNWGYVMADVNFPNAIAGKAPNRLNALVIAIPQGDGWSVVAAAYGAL